MEKVRFLVYKRIENVENIEVDNNNISAVNLTNTEAQGSSSNNIINSIRKSE